MQTTICIANSYQHLGQSNVFMQQPTQYHLISVLVGEKFRPFQDYIYLIYFKCRKSSDIRILELLELPLPSSHQILNVHKVPAIDTPGILTELC